MILSHESVSDSIGPKRTRLDIWRDNGQEWANPRRSSTQGFREVRAAPVAGMHCVVVVDYWQVFSSRRVYGALSICVTTRTGSFVNRLRKAVQITKNSLYLLRLPAILRVPFREVAIASSSAESAVALGTAGTGQIR